MTKFLLFTLLILFVVNELVNSQGDRFKISIRVPRRGDKDPPGRQGDRENAGPSKPRGKPAPPKPPGGPGDQLPPGDTDKTPAPGDTGKTPTPGNTGITGSPVPQGSGSGDQATNTAVIQNNQANGESSGSPTVTQVNQTAINEKKGPTYNINNSPLSLCLFNCNTG